MSRKVLVADDAAQWDSVNQRVKRLEQGALGGLPIYDTTDLPGGAPDGAQAIVDMPGGFRSLVVKDDAISIGTSWVVLTPHPIAGTGTPATFTSTAAAQWNKPSPTHSVTLPFGGSYRFEGRVEAVTNAVQTIIGVGAAVSTLADTASPTVIGTTGEDAANTRIAINLHLNRITNGVAGDVWDLRFFMQTIATMQFARTTLWAWPVYIHGVA